MGADARSNVMARVRTCAECGVTAPFDGEWRWGTDPLGAYISEHLKKTFCSALCELRHIEKGKS